MENITIVSAEVAPIKVSSLNNTAIDKIDSEQNAKEYIQDILDNLRSASCPTIGRVKCLHFIEEGVNHSPALLSYFAAPQFRVRANVHTPLEKLTAVCMYSIIGSTYNLLLMSFLLSVLLERSVRVLLRFLIMQLVNFILATLR